MVLKQHEKKGREMDSKRERERERGVRRERIIYCEHSLVGL